MPKNILIAAFDGDINRINEILDADPNKVNVQCLPMSCPVGHQVVAKSLLVGKKLGSLFLIAAALIGEAPAVGAGIAFLASGTLLGGAGALWKWGDTKLQAMTEDRGGWTPLHFAAYAQSLETVLYLIHRGADVTLRDRKGRTYLDFAPSEQFKRTCRDVIVRRNNLQRLKIQLRELGQQLDEVRAHEAQLVNVINARGQEVQQLRGQLNELLVERQLILVRMNALQAEINAENEIHRQRQPLGHIINRGIIYLQPFQAPRNNAADQAAPEGARQFIL
ncbi:MAG: hypothetical protein A3F41_02140 [Coxiella sp. RIFCSPHIGHO2_12_FULL_44_14]|nr:MAG: hypothetical protein A3F41_02140 [Coxiella sp. RIFCSPHIGHO2_12_FULL_44_14]